MIMPRIARKKSNTGIYHVMLRGIDKRDIFLNESDYAKFIHYIKRAKERVDFTLYGYCLMTNHVHLLLKTESSEVGEVVKRISVGYVQYHNIKNGRTGHLFQNRFKSEIVESDRYFLTLLRYIHQNPIKAGMVKNIEKYPWSSYLDYIHEKSNSIIDTAFGLRYFRDMKEFELYMKESNEDERGIENESKSRYTDEDLRSYISTFVNINRLHEIDKKSRNELIKQIKQKTKASNRQLSRVLGIGRAILDKIHLN